MSNPLYGSHIVPQIVAEPPLVHDNTLHVIGVLFNPSRSHRRLGLFREWYERMVATPHVKVYVVEAVFGDRQQETFFDDGFHAQVRTHSEIWVKENLINLAVRYLLPNDWSYMAWVDTDIEFRDQSWARETMQQLQHFPVLQPWRTCSDLAPLGGCSQLFTSFGYMWQQGIPMQIHPGQPYRYAHSGFAWACRRDFWEAAEGLLDFAVLGSADHHMAWACVGEAVKNSVHKGMSDGFKRAVQDWENRVVYVTNKDVGYVDGHIEHAFHGPKNRRGYRERWDILVHAHFDPFTFMTKDQQGLCKLRHGHHKLEREIRKYNRDRHDDSIEET